MSLQIGIVGLPNVGKSTLFRALTKKQVPAENYPFTTIDPNVGVVEVPDERLPQLAKVSKSKKVVPAICEFVDIAGLVRDAHKGEGLGNKFLANIREVAAIAHVVRVFTDADVIHVENRVDPVSDVETIETELALADLDTVKKRMSAVEGKAKTGDKTAVTELPLLQRLEQALASGTPARSIATDDDTRELVRTLSLLSGKPVLYVANVDESELKRAPAIQAELAAKLQRNPADIIVVSAKIEAELAELAVEDAAAYLKDLGLAEPGLNRLIRQAFATLGLQTFFTSGEMESKAWTIPQGTAAPQAAGVIHTDFEQAFIRAEIMDWKDLVAYGEHGCKEKGILRVEGKDYVMRDGDVAHFRVGV
ncbi:MAG: redox-regulated ATPase YchF [Patescibacteria group bacterium]